MASNNHGAYQVGQHQAPVGRGRMSVFLFRSKKQAEGCPLKSNGNFRDDITGPDPANPNRNIVIGQKYLLSKDNEYKNLESLFGFDIFRPELYDDSGLVINSYVPNANISTCITHSEIDRNNNTINHLYQITPHFALDNSNGAPPYRPEMTYFRPNLMIRPNQTVTIYAKLFIAEMETDGNRTMTIGVSSNDGIDSFTPSITFNQQRINHSRTNGFPVQPITITTSANQEIENEIILTITDDLTNRPVGQCTLVPNKIYKPKIIFVHTTYNSNPPGNPPNYTELLNSINKKAFFQAGIELTKNKTQTLRIEPTSTWFDIYSNNHSAGFRDSLENQSANDGFNNIDLALKIANYSFFKNYAENIIRNVETYYRTASVEVGEFATEALAVGANYYTDPVTPNTYTPILDANETIESIFQLAPTAFENQYNSPGSVDRLVCSLVLFLKSCRMDYFPCFIFPGISPYSVPGQPYIQALGFIPGKGALIPKEVKDKPLLIAHEIGHNFNLKHTFPSPPEGQDISLDKTRTRENIMDYVGDEERAGFIRYQWNLMREFLEHHTNNVEHLDFTTNDAGYADPPGNYDDPGNYHYLYKVSDILLNYVVIRKFRRTRDINNRAVLLAEITRIIKAELNTIRNL